MNKLFIDGGFMWQHISINFVNSVNAEMPIPSQALKKEGVTTNPDMGVRSSEWKRKASQADGEIVSSCKNKELQAVHKDGARLTTLFEDKCVIPTYAVSH